MRKSASTGLLGQPCSTGQSIHPVIYKSGIVQESVPGHEAVVGQFENPDPKHVSTSYAERNKLNVRMHSRRMTRLTNAFSKKMENHAYVMTLHFLYYNFVRIHKTLKVTPAMAAGVTS